MLNRKSFSFFVITLAFFVFTPNNIFSQNWLVGNGGATNDEALDITSDALGNYYVTGYFTSQVAFGSTTLNSSGNSDIFIAKYNAMGVVQWAVKAGGAGADRGYSIKTDDAGNLFVTGYYFGTATFGASTINSVAGTQDVFIAKYTVGGALQWVRSVGGNDAETGYGITSDHNGNVIITGQFKGTATFGTTTFTSMLNPLTGLRSFDIFIIKYDPSGNFIWAEQGKAKYDDRGLDVAVDLNNNIFVVGQFSDTVVFDAIHNNAVMNAGYLIKYDPNGNEQWFVKMSALQTIVYGIAVDTNDDIVITGDYKGNLAIFTSPIIYNTSAYTNKIFIAKFNSSGNVLWVDNDGSDNEITSKSVALDNAGNIYIAGLFKCRFDEYSQPYGTGVFYSSGYRDVFITKYSASGTRQWFKQFGSNKDDYCSGITIKTVDKPVIAGSFENIYNVPKSSAFTMFSSNFAYPTYYPMGVFCSQNNYQDFIGIETNGQKDIFLTSPIDASQAPFDFFRRTTSVCNQDFIKPCINNCQDTIEVCDHTTISANTFELDTNYIGAQYNFIWSTGGTTPYPYPTPIYGTVNSSGMCWLKSVREDGCFQNIDTVQIIIHPNPAAPWITDSYAINVNQAPSTNPVVVCAPDTITLWGTHSTIADTVFWTGPSHQTLNDSTVNVYQTGEYFFNCISDFGCASYNNVLVKLDTLDPITVVTDPHIIFVDSILQNTDTIRLCYGQSFSAYVIDSALYPTNNGLIPNKNIKWRITPSALISPTITDFIHPYVSIKPFSSGLYTLHDTVFSPPNACGTDTTKYYVTRSFYVIINPNPIIVASVTGPNSFCPTDTITLFAASNSQNYFWFGGTIVNNYHDSIQVMPPNPSPVVYGINITLTDTVTGCFTNEIKTITLNPRPAPIVTINPSDGIVCPGDSVLLTCQAGINYYWISPNGDSIGTTQSIYVNDPGYYHCIHTAIDGCIMTSNFVEAKEYNTPYLVVEPSNFICASGNAIISVQASASALIQWQAPLSGNAISQTVNTPGTYICHITQCGITTIDSIVIISSNTPSYIVATDSIICPGDTIVLTGNSGMIDYLWYPGNVSNQILFVTTPGTYTLRTTDANGCYGYSAPFTIYAAPQPPPPTINDTTICAGQSITLTTNSTGIINWYTSQTSTNPIFSGNSFTTPIINSSTTYYLQTYDSVCSSTRNDVIVSIYSSSITPIVIGDTTLCVGDSLFLSTVGSVSGLNYNWTDALGNTYTTQSVSISNINQSYQGIFTLQYSDANCSSPIDTINVFVSPIPTPHISPDSTVYICAGTSSSILQIDSVYTSYLWFPTSQNTQSISVSSSGTYYATVTQNGCTGTSNSVVVNYSPPITSPIANGITVCVGASATLSASGVSTLTWFDALMNPVATGTTYTVPIVDSSLIFYVQSINASGCTSAFVPVQINALQNTIPPNIYSNTPLCTGDNINLSTDFYVGATYSWSGPNGFSSSVSSPSILNVSPLNSGTYQLVVSVSGCNTPAGISTITVFPTPVIPALSGNTIYCEEDNLFIEVVNPQTNAQYYWWSSTSAIYSDSSFIDYNSLSLLDSGQYYFGLSVNGCYNDTTFNIIVKPKPTASINANNALCEGETIYIYADTVAGGSYLWNGPNGFVSYSIDGTIINSSVSNSGIYSLVTTLNGCNSNIAQTNIQVVPYPIIDLGNDTAFCLGNSITFTLPNIYSYLWNDNSTSNTFVASDSGIVSVVAAVGPGCSTTDSVLVDDYHCLANVPNVISPNGDGINDYLFFYMEGMTAIECEIYDRWGVKLYFWNDINGYWDGRRLKGDMVNDGVYFYIVKIWDMYKQLHEYKGFVHVIK